MNTLTTVAVIIAITEAVKSKVPQLTGIFTVVFAVVLGGVIGFLGLNGENLVSGVVAGFTSVGVHTTAIAVSGK